MYFLNTIINSILDIVFPVKCISCNKTNIDLCQTCLLNSPPAERESAKWIFPIYDYRDPIIKKALWLLKYKGKKRLAKIFAEIIYEKILEELSELSLLENFREPILIPIPLSPKRYRERGYNQAELICKELVRLFNERQNVHEGTLGRSDGDGQRKFSTENFRGESVDILPEMLTNILIKIKETKHQAKIRDRKTRLKNLSGSFSIKNEYKNINLIKNRNIILIDDITTTGATLNEAKKVLKQAGARKVIAFTIAH